MKFFRYALFLLVSFICSTAALAQSPANVVKQDYQIDATDPGIKLDDPFAFSAWSDESFALAQEVAYHGIKKRTKPTAEYNRIALETARKRVAWGGYRLAALLNSIWP